MDEANLKGVIYARYSSSGQRDESIEGQLRECNEYAAAHGISIVGTYEDRALSGTSDKRPGFQKMIKDSAKRQFQFVICWKNDRFARSRYDSAIYKAKLKANGVRVLYAKESIPEGPEGIILESIMEGYAEYYSANLSQNIKRGNYDSALKLQVCGVQCFGLREGADNRYEKDPDTAPIVKEIFDRYIAGEPAKKICEDLTNRGVRSIRGNTFNKTTIRRILTNEKYKGVYDFCGVRDEHGIPAIVDERTFERAQEALGMHKRNKTPEKIEGGYLLTGKVYCGLCGEALTGESAKGRNGIYYYYLCNGVRKKICKKKRNVKQDLEDIVIQSLVSVLHSEDMINAFADHFMEWQKSRDIEGSIRGLQQRLRETEKGIKNIISSIEHGIVSDALTGRLKELETQKITIAAEIAKEKIKEPELERTAVLWFFHRFKEKNFSDIEWKITLVETFVKKIFVYEDKIIIILNISGPDGDKLTVPVANSIISSGEKLGSCSDTSGAPHLSQTNTRLLFYDGIAALAVGL